MNTIGKRFMATVVGLTLAIGVSLVCCDRKPGSNPAGGATPATKVLRVQFGWTFDAHHAGFLVAKAKGFFSERGLSVELLPGGIETSAVRAVVSGGAEIGQASGPEQLLLANAEGHKLLGFAVFHRSSPHALISTSRTPVRSLEDLAGKRIAVAYGDTAEIMLRAALARKPGLDTSVTLQPFRFDLTPLMAGQVDAVTGFKTDQPLTLADNGFEPVVFDYLGENIRSYGYLFFTRADRLVSERSTFESFVSACRKGWEYAFANPTEAIDIVLQTNPAVLKRDVETRKLELVRGLMLESSGQLATWDADRSIIAEVAERLRVQGLITSIPAYDSVFDSK
jgi:NitT/TauT family transport system substrate-binding protein